MNGRSDKRYGHWYPAGKSSALLRRSRAYVVSGILWPAFNGVLSKTARGALEKLRRPTTFFRGFLLESAGDWVHHNHHLDVRFRQASRNAQLKDAIGFDATFQ